MTLEAIEKRAALDLLNSLGIVGPNIRHEHQTRPDPKWDADERAVWDMTLDQQWCVCGREWPCEAMQLGEAIRALRSSNRLPGAPGGVHDHTPEEGKGVGCPEYLIGECRLAALRSSNEELRKALGELAEPVESIVGSLYYYFGPGARTAVSRESEQRTLRIVAALAAARSLLADEPERWEPENLGFQLARDGNPTEVER